MSTPVDVDNLNMLKELIGDDLKEILNAYLSTAPGLLNQIENAILSKNSEDLRLHAHSLKGSSANIGAHPLSQVSATLEQMGKDNDIGPQAEQTFNQIKNENTAVVAFLNSYMEQM